MLSDRLKAIRHQVVVSPSAVKAVSQAAAIVAAVEAFQAAEREFRAAAKAYNAANSGSDRSVALRYAASLDARQAIEARLLEVDTQ